MEKIKYTTQHIKISADHLTPVLIYQRVKEIYPCSSLLESFEQRNHQQHYSYIAFDRLGHFQYENGKITTRIAKNIFSKEIHPSEIISELDQQLNNISFSAFEFPFSTGGFLGYLSYDAAIAHHELSEGLNSEIPLFKYQFYKYFLVFDHFRDEVHLFENLLEEESCIDEITHFIQNGKTSENLFNLNGDEIADMGNEEFISLAKNAKNHCARGDVFQLVLSRKFEQKFKGDDFAIYRELRRLNPSPYLFYFDFGNFHLFGSSPEAQLILKKNIAKVNPIAGTYKKTGDSIHDNQQKENLLKDEKEIAEHMMLVDLARNDLNKTGLGAKVIKFREIEEYSHVFHLVSEIETEIKKDVNKMEIVFNTYPAGTLTGAPKHKAMQLIQQYEKSNREFYGGCIGIIDSNKNFNHAITIRSILSKNNTLTYRAGAGITIQSDEKNELEEINNKLNALRTAIQNVNNNY